LLRLSSASRGVNPLICESCHFSSDQNDDVAAEAKNWYATLVHPPRRRLQRDATDPSIYQNELQPLSRLSYSLLSLSLYKAVAELAKVTWHHSSQWEQALPLFRYSSPARRNSTVYDPIRQR